MQTFGSSAIAAITSAVKSTGYATTLTNYRNWWHGFWGRSFVQYSNAGGDADYLENVYYLSTYMIAAGGYGNYPVHFINGVFRATGDQTKWSNAYWYWNQRDVYNSFLSSNHPDLLGGFNRLYSRNYNALKAYTQTRYGIDGLWVPETMGWDGNARGTVGSDYTKDIMSTGFEAAYNMYLQYRYTNDATYLRDVAYPYLREVAKFYSAKLSRDAAGKYFMANSNAHETYWQVPNAITDLAAVRTRAEKTATGWRINGQKVWSSAANSAKYGLLLARTGPEKHRGLSIFVMPMDTPGVTVRPLTQMDGESKFNEVFFDGVELSDGDLIGEAGQGWAIAIVTLGRERLTLGSQAVAMFRLHERMVDAAVDAADVSAVVVRTKK